MCGIIGIIGNKPACEDTILGLDALQHRGIQSTGIISYNSNTDKFSTPIRDVGSVEDVFYRKNANILNRKDNIAIGHNRYATSGDDPTRDAQPMFIQKPGLAIAYNGQITNYMGLRDDFEKLSYSFFTNCDVEAMLFSLAKNMMSKLSENNHQIENMNFFVDEIINPALKNTMDTKEKYSISGAYSTVAILANYGLLAFKDPHGIRPLMLGKKNKKETLQYCFASETTALNKIRGFEDFYELKPGEMIFIDKNLNIHQRAILEQEEKCCPFEQVYFSQVDSRFRSQQVYTSREKLGVALAKQFYHLKDRVDVVMPIPKSPIPSAITLARSWEKEYGGIIARDTRSKTRAFQQDKLDRNKLIDEKLIFVEDYISNKRIALVDDSIVRGDTSKNVVSRLRELGAKEIHFFSSYPPFIGVCPGGIDIPIENELLINNNSAESVEEARRKIGVDSLNYLSLEEMLSAINLKPNNTCLGCTKKEYPVPMEDYKRFQQIRGNR